MTDLDRATDLLLQMPPVAQEHFIRQWGECQYRFEVLDWFERAELTLKFYAENEWDGVRWVQKV
jgi:hypothetical protein